MFFKKNNILLIFVGFIIFFFVFQLRVKDEMVDFEVNYLAGKRIRMNETLYQIEDGHYQFKYPPFSALLYLPLSFLPLSVAKALWYSIVIFSSGMIFYLSLTLLYPKQRRSLWLTILPLLILAKFFLRELQLGQINAFITLIILLMVVCLVYEERARSSIKEMYSGVLLGLATALKPYALIFFPYFFITKKWKSFLSGLAFLTLTFFLPSFFYGFHGNIRVLQEWKLSLSQSTPDLLKSQDNVSIIAFFLKWTGHQKASFFMTASMIVVFAFLFLIIVLKGKNIPKPSVLDSSILLILIPLISPLGWDYTLLMSALGITIILNYFLKYSKFWRVVLIINLFIITFSLYDIMGREFYAAFMSWSVITINFIILTGYLVYLRLKKIC